MLQLLSAKLPREVRDIVYAFVLGSTTNQVRKEI
jgi:hypothetical protein